MVRPPCCLLVVAATAAACAAPPPPLAEPAVPCRVQYAATGASMPEPGSPQVLHIAVLALRHGVPGPSVDLAAALITGEAEPAFRGASWLPPGTRWLTGAAASSFGAALPDQAAGDVQELGRARAVLATGLRVHWSAATSGLPELQFLCTPHADGAATTLRLRSGPDQGPRQELHLAAPLDLAAPAVLFVPSPRQDLAGHAIVLHGGGPAEPTAVAAAFAAATPAPPEAPAWPAPWRAVFAAVGEHNRRPALLAVARPLAVPRCLDTLLVADERALIDITAGLAADLQPTGDLAWPFERAVWRALLTRLERDELPPALQAALRRHLGALGDDAAALRLVTSAATDAATFLAAVREENLAALADREAARRVSGHDWLVAHGETVAGFDPLAPAAARRDALRQHAQRALVPEANR